MRTQSKAFAYALFLLASLTAGLQMVPTASAECHCATSSCYLAAYDENGDGALDETERAKMESEPHEHAFQIRKTACPEDLVTDRVDGVWELLGGLGLVGGLAFFGRRRRAP